MAYRLTAKAEDDVISVFLQGVMLFGERQAEAYHHELTRLFALIAENPSMARERRELDPPMRVHPHKAHLVIYRVEDDGDVLIVRLRHAGEDWDADPL